jgi:hypothetical protein
MLFRKEGVSRMILAQGKFLRNPARGAMLRHIADKLLGC